MIRKLIWCALFHTERCGHIGDCLIEPITIPQIITLPKALEFNWKRDYGPLWEPGSTAFWLTPEPGDLPAGVWPLPFVQKGPLQPHTHIVHGVSGSVHAYYDADGNLIESVEVGKGDREPHCESTPRLLSVRYHTGSTMFRPGEWVRLQR